jgi:hypothetical protein
MNKPHIRWEECFLEGALTEIVVAYDRGAAKHGVQRLHEPEELLWLVVGEDGKSDFDRHRPPHPFWEAPDVAKPDALSRTYGLLKGLRDYVNPDSILPLAGWYRIHTGL